MSGPLIAGALLLLAPQEAPSFTTKERIVLAYYHYSGPESKPDEELEEMGRAGVDVALVVSSVPSEGLDPLVQTLDRLEKESKDRPRLAPCIPPTREGAAWAVGFDGRVPPRHRAAVDGRPLLWILPGKIDPAAFEEAWGGRPAYRVAEASLGLEAERTFVWGASWTGPRDADAVSVGPGSAEPERDREEGRFYERAWTAVLRLDPRMVAIESWNGAGNGVSRTTERGGRELETTRRYTRHYKNAQKMAPPKGRWSGAQSVLYTLKYNPREQGLRAVEADDGLFDVIQLRGVALHSSKENRKGPRRHLYFEVDDAFCYYERRPFQVTVEFLDSGEGTFTLEYDSGDRTLGPAARAFKRAGEVRFTSTGEWRTETFDLPDAVFGNGQAGGADFRLAVENRGLAVRRILVAPRSMQGEPAGST